jgi:hypothetical protein
VLQVKAKFRQRGVEIVTQLYKCTDADEGLMIDILRLEVSKLTFSITAITTCVQLEHYYA